MPYVKQAITEALQKAMAEHHGHEPLCDFCGDPNPVVQYAATQLTSGELAYCWRWAACAICEKLVDNDQWAGIHEQLVQKLLSRTKGMGVPKVMIGMAVSKSLSDFHRYVVRE